jgi:hypothetical protein
MLVHPRASAVLPTSKLLSCMVVLIVMSGSSAFPQSKIKTPSSFEEAIVAEPQTFPLWENGAPGALGKTEADQPTLTYYPPVDGNRIAIVIAPGGGCRDAAAKTAEPREIRTTSRRVRVKVVVSPLTRISLPRVCSDCVQLLLWCLPCEDLPTA